MGLISFLKNKFSKKENKSSLDSYNKGLDKSRKNFASKLAVLANKYKSVNEDYFEELEEILIGADVGVSLTIKVIEELLIESKKNHISEPKEINELLVDKLFVNYANSGENIVNDVQFAENSPTIMLVVGVNGVGKTTTIAKLSKRYLDMGKKVAICAADTFRAGAVEQLSIWGERLNIPVVKGKENSDPASVAFDGVRYAKNNNIDLMIIDTAGRMETKKNLMDELSKIVRVIKKEIPEAPHEVFLIIDATTGQNGVNQAKVFVDAAPITGAVITKMDGTSKGGILLAIRDELGVPVRFIGLGEKMDDLKEFDLDSYLYGLCLGESNE